MKVVQINCVYKNGSTGRIVENIHKYLLNDGDNSIVLYGRGSRISERNVYKVSSEIEAKIHSVANRLFSVEFGYSPIATHKAISIIKKEKPDVVHLHIPNGNYINYYKLLNFLKEKKIKTVITLHAEILHTAGCEHAMDCEKWKTGCYGCSKREGAVSKYFRDDAKHCYNLIKNAFDGFEDLTFVGASDWVAQRAKQSAITPESAKFYTVYNGIDTSVFHYIYDPDLRNKLNIGDNKRIILHVTPNFNHLIKGGKYVIELAKKMPDYQFIIVGFNGNKADLPDNILAIEHTKDGNELAKYYSMADCFICTSLRETFPTVCLEAVSCGSKIVAFDSGGIKETIPSDRGECVECYDITAFEKAVRKWADTTISQEEKSKYTQDNDLSNMAKHYIEIYRKEN